MNFSRSVASTRSVPKSSLDGGVKRTVKAISIPAATFPLPSTMLPLRPLRATGITSMYGDEGFSTFTRRATCGQSWRSVNT